MRDSRPEAPSAWRTSRLLTLSLLVTVQFWGAAASGSRSLLARTNPKDFAKPDYSLYHHK